MKKIHILVEGQTEETFVRRILEPHLSARDTYPIPILVKTGHAKGGAAFKGGFIPYGRMKRDILHLLGDRSATLVTTMLDFCGLADDFPGKRRTPNGSCYERASFLEEEFRRDIGHDKFLPYLMLHEFEAMLFVAPEHVAELFPSSDAEAKLLVAKRSFQTPEEINDRPETCPSARILGCLPEFKKTLHGPLAINRIGLERIRGECRHLDAWLKRLESLP